MTASFIDAIQFLKELELYDDVKTGIEASHQLTIFPPQ
jgi:hypothetical protein